MPKAKLVACWEKWLTFAIEKRSQNLQKLCYRLDKVKKGDYAACR